MTSNATGAEQVDATTSRAAFHYDAWVPTPLPDGKTEDDLIALVITDLVGQAVAAGYALDHESVGIVSDEPYPHERTGAAGRRVVFRGHGWRVRAQETAVRAVQDGDVWVADVGGHGLYSVKHGLGTEAVEVECRRSNGEPIGCASAVAIDAGDVTVFALPGTAQILVSAAPDEPESDDELQG